MKTRVAQSQLKAIRALSVCLALGLAGCFVEMPEIEVVCSMAIPAGVEECFEDASHDRVNCWSDVTDDDRFSGYFSDIYDRPLGAEWRGLLEPWLVCGEEYDEKIGHCVGVSPRTELPEVWSPDLYAKCLEPPKNHWGHLIERTCWAIEYEVTSACIGAANDHHAGEAWSDAVAACQEAHYARQWECLDEEDFRKENCFINISDLFTCTTPK